MSEQDDILIERFLKDQLSEEEKQLVLERLESDPEFKEKIDLERSLMESLDEKDWHFVNEYNEEEVKEYTEILKSEELKDLKKELQRLNDLQPKQKVVNGVNWRRIGLSAAAVIAIMFAVFTFTNNSESPQELYVEYLEDTKLPSLVSRAGTDDDVSRVPALYKAKDFEKALSILNRELNSNPNNDASILIYKGVAEMQLGNNIAAELAFDTLLNSDLIDAQKGHWYKALLQLKQENIEGAKPILEHIVSKQLFKAESAEQLLKKID